MSEKIDWPYVIYCRRSTDEPNKQQDSIPAQIKACVEYRERCWNFDIADRLEKEPEIFLIDEELEREYEWNDVYKPYIDKVRNKFVVIERRSAKKSNNRKRRKELIRLVNKWKIKWILSYSPDRCSRNMLEAWELIDLVDNRYINLKFTNFAFEDTPSGKMMLAVLFGFAKHYSDNRAEMTTRGQNNKGLRWEALWPWKYWYLINDNNCFEPHPKYRELMQMAFTMRLYNKDVSDSDVADWLNQEWFKTVKRVGKSNALYGKQKYIEESVNFKNLWDVRIDPFYYGILTYWDERYDQRDLNENYGEPMIDEETHAILVERSQKHYTFTQNKEVSDISQTYLPFPPWMVVTQEWKNFSGNVPGLHKRHGHKLEKLKETNPEATYWDIVMPHQVKYRRREKWYNINMSALDIMNAFRKKLYQLKYLEEHYNVYVDYVRDLNAKSQKTLNEKRQVYRLQKGRKEKARNQYLDKMMPILKQLSPLEKERYYNRLTAFEKEIKDIDKYISSLEEDRRQDIVTALVMCEYMQNAVEYYDKATYVQQAQIASIFLSNIVIWADKSVDIRVKPMLEDLFSGTLVDSGFEPLTSTMST